jgi:hypothetical protein
MTGNVWRCGTICNRLANHSQAKCDWVVPACRSLSASARKTTWPRVRPACRDPAPCAQRAKVLPTLSPSRDQSPSDPRFAVGGQAEPLSVARKISRPAKGANPSLPECNGTEPQPRVRRREMSVDWKQYVARLTCEEARSSPSMSTRAKRFTATPGCYSAPHTMASA